jgi:hypothetical protein
MVASSLTRTDPDPQPVIPEILKGTTHYSAELVSFLVNDIFQGLGALFLLIVFVAVLRRWWLGVAALFLLQGTLGILAGGPTGTALTLIEAFLLVRFGLLADVVQQALLIPLFYFPITTNISAWYAAPGMLLALVMSGLAVYGFYTSLAGRPLLGRSLLDEV